jgi:hypothetical protein
MQRLLLITALCLSSSICLGQSKSVVTISSDENGYSWKQFVSTAGHFSVLMPGEPKATTKENETTEGKPVYHSFAVNVPKAFYQVAYTEYAVALDQQFADRAVVEMRQIIRRNLGEILAERETKVGTVSGREWWIIQSHAAIGIMKTFVIGNRNYQVNMLMALEVAFKHGVASVKPEDQTELFIMAKSKFYESFQLIDDFPSQKTKPNSESLIFEPKE